MVNDKIEEVTRLIQLNRTDAACEAHWKLTKADCAVIDERFCMITASAGLKPDIAKAFRRLVRRVTPYGRLEYKIEDMASRAVSRMLELENVLANRERLELELGDDLPDYAGLPVGMSKQDCHDAIDTGRRRLERAIEVLSGKI